LVGMRASPLTCSLKITRVKKIERWFPLEPPFLYVSFLTPDVLSHALDNHGLVTRWCDDILFGDIAFDKIIDCRTFSVGVN